MLAMFRSMSDGTPPDRRYYLFPVHYFQKREDARWADIIRAVYNSS
jgi:hypothetical protein